MSSASPTTIKTVTVSFSAVISIGVLAWMYVGSGVTPQAPAVPQLGTEHGAVNAAGAAATEGALSRCDSAAWGQQGRECTRRQPMSAGIEMGGVIGLEERTDLALCSAETARTNRQVGGRA